MKKLNKNGFTLVELLAVIVILAVVILVAVNNVIPQMNKAKAGAFKTEALSFLDGAEQYYTSQQMTGGSFPADGVSIGELVTGKYVKSADVDKYKGCIKYNEATQKFSIKLYSSSYMTVDPENASNLFVEATTLSNFDGVVGDSTVIRAADTSKANNYNCK